MFQMVHSAGPLLWTWRESRRQTKGAECSQIPEAEVLTTPETEALPTPKKEALPALSPSRDPLKVLLFP